MGAYRETYDRSLTDPGGFWADAVAGIDWTQPPDRVLDDADAPLYHWFPDARLNTCFNAVDRHVLAGRGEQPALIYDSPVTDTVTVLTYADLLQQVSTFAGVLRRLGVGVGDRVVLYLPMVPQAVVAMLAWIGPVAALRRVDVVAALPKTRSGKILRRTMREIADGGDPPVPSTIEDPTVLERLAPALRG